MSSDNYSKNDILKCIDQEDLPWKSKTRCVFLLPTRLWTLAVRGTLKKNQVVRGIVKDGLKKESKSILGRTDFLFENLLQRGQVGSSPNSDDRNIRK